MIPVKGRCPACGASELRYGFQGHIECQNMDCDNRYAVDILLSDPEITEHLVKVVGQPGRLALSWTLRHPLIERLNDALFGCELGAILAEYGVPDKLTPGLYRAVDTTTGWEYSLVEETP